jgi:hypothetical protein
MKKFMILYKSTVSAEEQMAKGTPEQGKAAMEMWMKWSKKAGSAIVDLGSPLGNASQFAGGASKPIDGKAKGYVGGFSILQADSAKAVNELLKDHPHFGAPGASIEIHEFMQIPGM